VHVCMYIRTSFIHACVAYGYTYMYFINAVHACMHLYMYKQGLTCFQGIPNHAIEHIIEHRLLMKRVGLRIHTHMHAFFIFFGYECTWMHMCKT